MPVIPNPVVTEVMSLVDEYHELVNLLADTEPSHITDYCQQTVEVHGRPHTCARLNDHSGKHQVAVPQVGLVKW